MTEEEKEAIEEAKKQIKEADNLNEINIFMTDSTTLIILLNYIERLEKENERYKKESVSKKQIRNVLRKVQDYNLNFKDLALFNVINSELLGDNLWKDRIEEE